MSRKNEEERVKHSRLLKIDNEIRSGTYPNAKKLADKTEVTQRTIMRDLEYLKLFYDAPIEYNFKKRGFYYAEPNFFIKSVILKETELEAILEPIITRDFFMKLGNDDEITVKSRKAIDKIISVLPENKTNNIPFAPSEKDKINFRFAPTVIIKANIWYELHSAMKNKEIVEIEYWFSDNRKHTLLSLEILSINQKRLLAWENDNHDKPGVYSINRIRKVHNTGRHFEIPANFRIPNHLKEKTAVSPADNIIYLFELSFPKEIAAEAIERVYYHNQIIEKREDGTVFVAFKSTRLCDVFDWVLKQGSKVKVLNPPELVTMVKKEVQKVGQYYL